MRRLNQLLKLWVVFLLIGATVHCTSLVKLHSDIRWSGENTGISDKLENVGYYKYPSMGEAYIFYDDGTLVLSNKVPDDTISYQYGPWPPGGYFDTDLNRWDIGATGLYRVEDDTIHANLYFRNCFHFSLRTRFYFSTELWKLKFHILDSTTIVLCEEHYIDKEFPYPETRNDTLHFWESSQLPPPYTEMKKKRWLWQNKKDREKYKEEKKTYNNRKLNEKQ